MRQETYQKRIELCTNGGNAKYSIPLFDQSSGNLHSLCWFKASLDACSIPQGHKPQTIGSESGFLWSVMNKVRIFNFEISCMNSGQHLKFEVAGKRVSKALARSFLEKIFELKDSRLC